MAIIIVVLNPPGSRSDTDIMVVNGIPMHPGG